MKKLHILTLSCALAAFCACSDEPVPQVQPEDPGQGQETTMGGEVPVSLDIPDKAGMNIKGVVYCGNTPIEGVVVSDGVTVAKTDAKGIYYLNSDKHTGSVFVSVPGGYKVPVDKVFPRHFRNFSAAADMPEQINFELEAAPADDYVVMLLADIHLAGRNQDEEHYQNWFLKDINPLIADYRAAGKDVYTITLGDQSWNTYWYATDIPAPFTLTEMLPYLEKINAPVFNTMGNHDNDPRESSDFVAEAFWRRYVGPTYYSFNIGKIHYVVLDNIVYDNPHPGTLGDEVYSFKIAAEQKAWLKADLAALGDKSTPVYVMLHCPVHSKPKLDKSNNVNVRYQMDDGKTLMDVFAGFSDVKVFSGHAHINWSVQDPNHAAIREYNVGSVCATWWWTGKNEYPGNHICRDGSVGGYRVLEIDGKSMVTYYKSIGYGSDFQFRAYDVNECRITAPKYCPVSNNAAIATEIEKLTGASGAINCDGSNWHKENKNNEVVLNVFAYDPRWKIEVLENNRRLTVTRENGYDPLHIISTMCYRLQNKGKITATFQPTLTSHLFRVKTSSPTSTLTIRVTDQNGRTYTETMTRPRALEPFMDKKSDINSGIPNIIVR